MLCASYSTWHNNDGQMKLLAMAVIPVMLMQARSCAFCRLKNKSLIKHASGKIEGLHMERGTISNLSSLRIYALPTAGSLETHKQILLSSPPTQVPMGMQNWAGEIETVLFASLMSCCRPLLRLLCRNTWVY